MSGWPTICTEQSGKTQMNLLDNPQFLDIIATTFPNLVRFLPVATPFLGADRANLGRKVPRAVRPRFNRIQVP